MEGKNVSRLFKMKVQKSSKLSIAIILSLLLVISGCNTTEKTSQSSVDKVTGQLIKETEKIKGCSYSDGSICNQTCCKTGIACGDQQYSYKKCDIYGGIWDLNQYKNSDCTGSCTVKQFEELENKKEIKEMEEQEEVKEKKEQQNEAENLKSCDSIECDKRDREECHGTTKLVYDYYCYLDSLCTYDLNFEYDSVDCGYTKPKSEITEPIQEPIPTTSTIVSEIIDGDTVELETGEKVRLIGINTPEKNMHCYSEAKDKLQELIGGKEVELEKDVTDKDIYERLLRYIYIDNLFVNLEMVKLGLATAYEYKPDVKYATKLEEAENQAKEQKIGCLWKTSDYKNCIVVSNFRYDATGNDNYNLNDEYFTLKNTCPYSIGMTDWTAKDEATHIFTFPDFDLGINLEVTIYTGSGEDTLTELYWGRTSAIWNNDGDTLFLREDNGNLVLEEKY